ncbi:Major Facilitator Superfamily protein [Streptomyces sp. YIM 121038]|uniref:MFS transporter n=1 Tax=Streptomyces sp. YIM 121038 TaxID=2136401 RepID=UPI001110EDE0|nr:MFS transporter [Streptomyces sp. YIM 121038]QCX79784.1 Major Facilitator Superfamily protein [Streptomyces sp. YIM 121038]
MTEKARCGRGVRGVRGVRDGRVRRTADSYRAVLAVTGRALPVISFLGRLPVAVIQFGSVLLVGETSGSLATGGAVACALALGQVTAGPFVGRLADRRGQRPVVLAFAALNALAVAACALGALLRPPTPVLLALAVLAGASVPGIGPLARARAVALLRREDAPPGLVNAALSLESTLDELSFVLGPALVGLAAVAGHPVYAFAVAALLVAVCGTGFALHPTARAAAPAAAPRARATRSALPRTVYAVRVGLVFLGVLLGACGAGIAALTERLGAPGHAGLVYAAMGVMSAVAGLSTAALPDRFGLYGRWRAATAAAALLSLPLVWTDSLAGLYAVVTVFGAVYAPNLVTCFALTERAVPRRRVAEGMTWAASAFVGGQAVTLAVAGRLAETHGPGAAFALGSAAAAVACAIALVTRPQTAPGENAAPARADRAAEAPTRDAATP